MPWLPTAGSCSESLGCTKTKGPFCPAPPHAGEHSLCPLPSRPPGNKVKLGGRGLRTLRGRARGKPCPPPRPAPDHLGWGPRQEGREHPQGLQATPQGPLSTWRAAGGIPGWAKAAAGGGGSRGWLPGTLGSGQVMPPRTGVAGAAWGPRAVGALGTSRALTSGLPPPHGSHRHQQPSVHFQGRTV